MKRFCKKLFNFLFDKDMWVSTAIGSVAWTLFWVIGGYVAFVTQINPTYKIIFVIGLGVVLYFLYGVVHRAVFKKLGRKPPE